MKTLLFNRPVFHVGRNVTVQRGIKWSLEKVAYVEIGGVGISHDLDTKVMRFMDIDIMDLQCHHVPGCRYHAGLATELRSIYPDFQPAEVVTVVSFNLTKEDLSNA